jgi:hypothetical protein
LDLQIISTILLFSNFVPECGLADKLNQFTLSIFCSRI